MRIESCVGLMSVSLMLAFFVYLFKTYTTHVINMFKLCLGFRVEGGRVFSVLAFSDCQVSVVRISDFRVFRPLGFRGYVEIRDLGYSRCRPRSVSGLRV